ncbi:MULTISPECIES: FUSC family protein [Rhodococcus]|uniref:FUSC family protein n=1 Tax=Rhodococcus oxybenzonivorans TaxID=1990687 RepID=A0AAE5A8G4_9NOCA|nr:MULTISPECIES: FUSC family protein [Rhodococcus]MDV7242375.1 FUSC family protein [Rhodococcus oxybenzonivorans]MDV7267682.1 FUSC family protein [Rhodococcus oxybenzonivorans]MDV7277122.1 FUSC family protein [Rhodococcus oxybenzonivorans]MDV7331864.1 FUSC family protein [Rhodococcus oxybenzonivorans]MDV7344085.1 FUSC family protein [Rhodococcus oxybenzonivorans]
MQIPAPAPARSLLLGVAGQGRRWPGVVRAGAAAALPALAGIALGHSAVAATATLGAFAVVYGEGRAYRVRWRVVSIAAAALVFLAGVGAAVGASVHAAAAVGNSALGNSALWATVLVLTMTLVVAVCAFVVDGLRLGAPGAFLPLLTVEIASSLPALGVSTTEVLAWTASGAASALLVSMSGVVVRRRTPERAAVAGAVAAVAAAHSDSSSPTSRRDAVRALHAAWQCLHDAALVGRDHPLTRTLHAAHLRCAAMVDGRNVDHASDTDDLRPQVPLPRPSIRYRLGRAAHPRGRSWTIVARLLVACPAAGLLALSLDVGRPDWAVITAAMILHQGPDRVLGTYRGLHRFFGTVLGLGLLAVLATLDLTAAALVLVVALLMAGTEAFLVRNYGVAMVFITPLALIVGSLGTQMDLGVVTRDRLLETLLGVAVALVVLWIVLPRSHRRILREADEQVAHTIGRIADTRDPVAVAELCHDLEFDLHASTTAAITAAHTDPAWTRTLWPEHHHLHELGYRTLAWHLGPSM